MIPTRIYLCGGGVNVIAHIGVLKQIQKANMFSFTKIQEWMGVSAGSLMALCLVIGYTLDDLEHFFLGFDFRNITDLDSAPGWIVNYGMDTGAKLRKLVKACLHIKGVNDTITFQELYHLTRMKLRVFVTDLNTGKLSMFSPTHTPNRSVVDAVCASMSLPYYFQPVIDPETNHYLVDGGLVSNYPFFMLTPQEIIETLGIYFSTLPTPIEDFELEDFALRPLQILLNTRGEHTIKHHRENTILVNIGPRSPVNFDISLKEKQELLEIGQTAVKEYLANRRQRIQRRYSVS